MGAPIQERPCSMVRPAQRRVYEAIIIKNNIIYIIIILSHSFGVAEGTTLQKRGERSNDPAASARAFASAVEAFRSAFEQCDAAEERSEAALGMARGGGPRAWSLIP